MEDALLPEPALEQAVEHRDMDSFMRFMLGLSRTVRLDPKEAEKIFWQLVGHLSAEAGRKMAKPWQWAFGLTLSALFVTVIWAVWVITNQQWQFMVWIIQNTGGLVP